MTKRFALKALLFVAISLELAMVLQWALVLGLKKYNTSGRGVWNRVIQGKVNADVIICGSSRALVHFDPQLITALTGRPAFNLGRNGTPQDLQLSFLKTYLAHNRAPICIVQSVDIFGFRTSTRVYEPEQYIPYLDEPFLFDKLVAIDGSYELMRRFPLLGIIEHRLFLTALAGLLGLTAKEDHFSGYKPQNLKWTGDFEKYKANHPEGVVQPIEPEGISTLTNLMELCLQIRAKLVLVYSPEYVESQALVRNRGEVLARVQEIADAYGVEFWDFSNDPICRDKSLFYNSQHMNQRGAALFSREFAEQLTEVLSDNRTAGYTQSRAHGDSEIIRVVR